MKKMWNIRKDSSGVSPVIATILMVAITVVLAAVLYVMVSGFGGGGDATPTGDIKSTSKTSTAATFVFGPINPDTQWIDCKLTISGTADTVTNATSFSVSSAKVVTTGTIYLGDALVYNLGADDFVSDGDSIVITPSVAPDSGDTVVLSLIYGETGDVICTATVTF